MESSAARSNRITAFRINFLYLKEKLNFIAKTMPFLHLINHTVHKPRISIGYFAYLSVNSLTDYRKR